MFCFDELRADIGQWVVHYRTRYLRILTHASKIETCSFLFRANGKLLNGTCSVGMRKITDPVNGTAYSFRLVILSFFKGQLKDDNLW